MPLSKLDMVAWLVKPNGETPENPGAQQGPETPPQQDNSEVRRSARLNAIEMAKETMGMNMDMVEERMSY